MIFNNNKYINLNNNILQYNSICPTILLCNWDNRMPIAFAQIENYILIVYFNYVGGETYRKTPRRCYARYSQPLPALVISSMLYKVLKTRST